MAAAETPFGGANCQGAFLFSLSVLERPLPSPSQPRPPPDAYDAQLVRPPAGPVFLVLLLFSHDRTCLARLRLLLLSSAPSSFLSS